MFRFNGGQTVGKGTYWNLKTGEGIEVAHEKALPGDGKASYLRLPASSMIFLGPFFGLLFVCLIPLLTVFVALTLLSKIALASDAAGSEESAMCLGCHSTEGIVKTFKNNEKLSVFVAEKHFKGTVHSFLACTGCHSTVSMDTHPSSVYGSKREFALQVQSACRTCHADEQILARPLHKQALTLANAPPCSDCHGSHSIRKVSRQMEKGLSDSQYCLTCHKQKLNTSVNGDVLSLTIDEQALRKSVHSRHNCADCHVGFSRKEHPVKSFGGRRELSIAISEVCRRCHSDKYMQFEGSIHYSMLKGGNLKAPVCTDCHGSHTVGKKAILETISGVPCRKCHEGIFEDYAQSIHGMAKTNGKEEAPLCSSCHFAHEVRPALVSRSPKTACLGCHKNVADAHSEWLPNAELHFEAVACTACHVPDVGRRVYLNITDRGSSEVISASKVKELLGQTLTASSENGIESRQLWDIYQRLNDKTEGVTLRGTLGIEDCKQSHRLATKSRAVRQCDSCHSADSEFFKAVSMTVISPEGKEEFFAVNPAVLSSMLSVLPLNDFYVLGSTRVKLLDFLGIFMVIAGASFPALHITVRLLTRGIRESKKKEAKR